VSSGACIVKRKDNCQSNYKEWEEIEVYAQKETPQDFVNYPEHFIYKITVLELDL
jgi:hypothetical protein